MATANCTPDLSYGTLYAVKKRAVTELATFMRVYSIDSKLMCNQPNSYPNQNLHVKNELCLTHCFMRCSGMKVAET